MGAARPALVQTAMVINKTKQLESLCKLLMKFLLYGPSV
jgi:hypothetical protein